MSASILVINAGSSSIKFAVYKLSSQLQKPCINAKIVNIGQQPQLKIQDEKDNEIKPDNITSFAMGATHETLVHWLLSWLSEQDQGFTIKAVGHRVVHGGKNFTQATLVTPHVIQQLTQLIPLAPLHQAHNLSAIDAIGKWAPNLPQVACFDTSFHHTQDDLATLFAIPREYTQKGIIRYGFHGLSYDYIAGQLPQHLGKLAQGRIVVAHLGNGASMCALLNCKSVATSMGFTALDGLMMGQRCGSLDAGVILHLLQYYKLSVEDIERLLYKESGLLGVSGISNNMQVLQKSCAPNAKQAINLYCYLAARQLASLLITINGLDAIVFTAGIGEHSALVRQAICARLAWLGVALDEQANQQNKNVISLASSRVKVLVIATNEELVIAQKTHELIS